MKIMQTNYYKNNNYNISSGSCCRHYTEKSATNNEILTYTYLFRHNFNWEKLAAYIFNIIKTKGDAQVKVLGGSDGSDAYSVGISLLEYAKEHDLQLPKDFKILSLDKDSVITEHANNGRINLSIDNDMTKPNVHKYFTDPKAYQQIQGDKLEELKNPFITSFSSLLQNLKDFENKTIKSYKVADELKNIVEFKCGDLLQELKNTTDNGNSVILNCNVAKYNTEEYQAEVAKTIRQKLKNDSIYILGHYDSGSYLEYLLTAQTHSVLDRIPTLKLINEAFDNRNNYDLFVYQKINN